MKKKLKTYKKCEDNIHKNLNFTKEEEHKNSLNFLDVCVQRSVEGELLTKVHRKLNSETFYVPWVSFGPVKQNLGVLTGIVKRFTRLCSLCYLKGELNKLQNTFLSLVYPGNFVSKVITRARSSTALKMIGPQKCPEYLKLPYLGNISERFFKNIYEEVNQVFSFVRLRTILFTDRPLSGIYKVVSPTQEKIVRSSINLVVTVVETTWEKHLKGFM